MQRTLYEHVHFLEMRLQAFTRQVMSPHYSCDELNRIQLDIRAADLALSYYRMAFEIEQKLAWGGAKLTLDAGENPS